MYHNTMSARGNYSWATSTAVLLAIAMCPARAEGQLAPEIGYVHPAGGQAGTTVDVVLGGYDWTPDMQIFLHDPRIKLEMHGPPSPILVPEPPYWFGAKGRGPAWPLPREFTARLTIPADVSPGLVRFQVANANGPSPPGVLFVSDAPEVVEQPTRSAPQELPSLPVTVNGQIRVIEEVDQFQFIAPKDGPLTIELFARRLNSPLHGLLKIQDAEGKVLVDLADTEGRDLATTFIARGGEKYLLSLHDLDYAGDRSYVYRLLLWPGPRVQAAYPAACSRGQMQKVEFVGVGIATGACVRETVVRDVPVPAGNATSFDYVLETPVGRVRPFKLLISDGVEQVAAANLEGVELRPPFALTGAIETRFGAKQFRVPLKKDEKWQFTAQTDAIGSPLDLELTLTDADGKEVAMNDDAPGSTEPHIHFIAPADGTYTLKVTDRSGKSGDRAANYRLLIEQPQEGFDITVQSQLALPLGSPGKLPLKVVRKAGFKGAIPVSVAGLPEGVTASADISIPEGKDELVVELASQADAPAAASLATITASLKIGERTVTTSKPVLIATTLKPRVKISPEGLDDVRKVQRGSTFLAPLFIERLEGYQGPVTLEMTAKQQRHRQGLASDEFLVPPDAKKVEYPIFIPEWMETTKTSRMILNGIVQVPDPKGNMRTLAQRMELRIGVLPLGALLKIARTGREDELSASSGDEVTVPITLFRAADFREDVLVELVATGPPAGAFTAAALTLAGNESTGEMKVRVASDQQLEGEHSLLLRASAKKDGKWPVISETRIPILVRTEP
jgi:hypothetical protein